MRLHNEDTVNITIVVIAVTLSFKPVELLPYEVRVKQCDQNAIKVTYKTKRIKKKRSCQIRAFLLMLYIGVSVVAIKKTSIYSTKNIKPHKKEQAEFVFLLTPNFSKGTKWSY